MAFSKPTAEELQHRYLYHAPSSDQVRKYETVRAKCLELAGVVVALSPCCPEQTRALNSLDEVMFLANAAIARSGGK